MGTAIVTARPVGRIVGFWQSTVGKKALMAVTGVALFAFTIGHLLGNLQVFLGPERINAYGHALHELGPLLWVARIGLLVTVGLHILATVQLARRKKAARPQNYHYWKPTVSSYASRTMYWSGPIIAAFVVYHLMHLTWGNAHRSFIEGDVYHNLVTGFQFVPTSLFYLVAMGMLCMHLYHGLWSMFQTLGASHPRYTPLLRFGAKSLAFLIFAGYASMPLAVLAGVLK